MNTTNFSMYLLNTNPMDQELISKAVCLDLHGPLLNQLTYLKVVIGVLIAIIILFLVMNDRRKRKKS